MRVILFDADGVLTLPEEMFSRIYAKSRGLDDGPFEEFFKNEWADFVTGKRDLKEHIRKNNDLWQWDNSPDDLLQLWFESEDIQNTELLEIVAELRKSGSICCIATEQEKYRAEYMKNTMFPGKFDHYFSTAEIGVKKNNPEFFRRIFEELTHLIPGIQNEDVIFFDDSQSKVDAALDAGIDARLYTSIDQVRELLQ